MTTQEKLTHTRAAIVRWESRLRRAGNALKKYRAREARYVRKLNAETSKAAAPVAKRIKSRTIKLD